jgi:hypothetical protein
MPVLEAPLLDPWQGQNAESASTSSPSETAQSHRDVRETVTEILGYDIFEEGVLAAGYREMAGESLSLAEASLSASVETLPED